MRALALALLLAAPARAQQGDRFQWVQLKHAGEWDPYPDAHREALAFLGSVTSVLSVPARRETTLADPELFSAPFLFLGGRSAPPDLSAEEAARLRDYLVSGGFLWVEDASGVRASPFDRWLRRALAKALPDAELKTLAPDHVLFKTFFLVRRPAGRVLVSAVEGLDWGGKTVLVYTRNDNLGALAKDALGQPLHPCVPGGEVQRMESRKLTLNVLLYALTGTYKADAVHQPFLLEKMRQGVP